MSKSRRKRNARIRKARAREPVTVFTPWITCDKPALLRGVVVETPTVITHEMILRAFKHALRGGGS